MNELKDSIVLILLLLFVVFLVGCSYATDITENNSFNNEISQNDVFKGSKSLYNYINKNEKLPEYVEISNRKYSMGQFMYLMSKTVINSQKNDLNNITIPYNIKSVKNPTGSSINGEISSKDINSYSKAIINYMDNNNRPPNYIKSRLGNIQYETMIFAISKFLSKSSNGKLAKITISVSRKSPINNNGYTIGLFSKYIKRDSLKKYLSSTKNAPKDEFIKKLAKKLTKGCNTKLEKAEAIFNWVKSNIKYFRYGNTKYGAKKSIKIRKGNCVDNSHVLVSLFRASNIPTRYVNGKCKFIKGDLDGSTVSHVWVQVLINKKWIVADGTYQGNRLGYVSNWKINSYKLLGIYSCVYTNTAYNINLIKYNRNNN
ncbi:transglutaminase-like superfamily protein [Methanobrevibacter cuticularis]|uniref:Transglutaminase-like superfamily protein n=1 Tax=Methanobrevibacter cuticularis TaxID=47311 RepID=A0A166CSQ6_9EURY|nr:transglutaminase-like domain-containing protein [Methanobrevibacter cuticularis]KZX14823.1 transglutaminase-like superfamily protein [Methanobrevibacter cuticularis]